MDRLRTPAGLLKALVVLFLVLGTGWLAIRAAIVRSSPAGAVQRRATVLADDPDVVLAGATHALVERRGILPDATLEAVRRAAARAPLDARPYLILGHQALLDRQDARALRLLEAGQRLDPRQRLIHILLLDRYLRSQRFDEASDQFALLARLVGGVQAPTAALLAQMIVRPETRAAALRTLREDPALERTVLVALARTTVAPATLFSIASPSARAAAARPDGWGTALLQRLMTAGRVTEARQVWQRLFSVPADKAASLLYDPRFEGWPGSPPFDWSLASGSIGVVDIAENGVSIEYYGRDSGELVSQSLVLTPGRYQFSFAASESSSPGGTPTLVWTLTCIGGPTSPIMTLPLSLAASPRRFQAAFDVPTACPGQRLVLSGNAAEFSATTRAAINNLSLQRAGR